MTSNRGRNNTNRTPTTTTTTKDRLSSPADYDPHAGEEKKMEDRSAAARRRLAAAAGGEDPAPSSLEASKPLLDKKNDDDDVNDAQSRRDESAASSPTLSEKKSASAGSNNNKWCTAILGTLLRGVLLDLPLIVIFSLYVASIGIEQVGNDYFLPQLELQRFTPEKAETDLTYYHRACDASDQTARDTAELVVTPEMSTAAAVDLMLTHGAAALPGLLSAATARELREFILEENEVSQDLIYVIENNHRWSFPMTVDQHPSVPKALSEVLNKPQLVDLLEAVVGPNPAVIEFTAITCAYGAVGQYWHQDVVPEGNAAKYGRNFVPSYSLFIPLQNTTAAMGATGLCPGTHMCAAGCDEFCADTAFQVSGARDNWPLGTGALVNQQTTHRGEAHTDSRAPHRVVFIVTFAPRPQTAPQTVETRMIGHSGSYSLHSSQWSHTLREFQQPAARMTAQPWRTLRSLGLHKPRGSHWGWDYLTVSSCRIANSDTGFSSDDLSEFLEKGGFWWLPRSLHGEQNDDESSMAWVAFLRDTVVKCQAALRLAHRGALAWYAVATLVAAWASGRLRFSTLVTTQVRLATLHLVVLLFAWWTRQRIANSTWGRNIRSERSFTLPETLALAPDLPATLPTKNDILVLEGMQSSYFASFTRVLEVTHPGNKAWQTSVSRVAQGYSILSSELQKQVCLSLLLEARQQQQRILVKNLDGNWAEAPLQLYMRFCHKSVMQRSHPLVGAVVQSLDFLLSEARFGYWRETALHRKFVSEMIVSLQNKILGFQPIANRNSLADIFASSTRSQMSLGPIRTFLPMLPKDTRDPLVAGQRNALPVAALGGEPYPSAWIKEGDTVEAIYDGDFSEWYRGITTHASSNRMVWEVEFDDGDVQIDIPAKGVRKYVPYQVDESIEVRLDEVTYGKGRVVAFNADDDTFDIEVQESGEIFTSVQPMDIRRRVGKPRKFAVGERVQAMFPGAGDEYFLGTITGVHPKGVGIEYDDGDYIEMLPLNMVK